jgi:hypothetical protein
MQQYQNKNEVLHLTVELTRMNILFKYIVQSYYYIRVFYYITLNNLSFIQLCVF